MQGFFAMFKTAVIGLVALILIAGNASLAQSTKDSEPLLTLDEAIQIAVNNNRPLKISNLEITKSQWQVKETKTKQLPAISTYLFGSEFLLPFSFQFDKGSLGTVDNQPVPSENKQITTNQQFSLYAAAQVAQPLSQLYQIHLAIREQELSVDMNREKARGQKETTVTDVKQAYYTILQTESSLQADAASIQQYQELLRVADQYLAQEATLKSDVLDVKARLAQERYKVFQLKDTLQTQKEQLNDLLGRDIRTAFHTEQVPAITPEEEDLQTAQQMALNSRPEIKQAEITVKQANYERRIAKSAYIPGIGLALHYVSPFNESPLIPTNILSAGVEMTWDPWDWGSRSDNVKQKTVSLSQSQYQLKEVQSQVLIDVDNRFRKLAESRILLTVAQASRDAAVEKLREVTNQYGQKTVLLSDVLKQQAAVASADSDYEQALLSFWLAKANFEKSLGED
ncbi:MAG TPA: TolC family protein [Acidobacteriaceae bacterium]|jgi:outer membrane protein TolC|nr:TolC family protein [Acidobacteriaceae bacterium]